MSGAFSLLNLLPRECTLRASKEGYDSTQESITVFPFNDTDAGVISLAPGTSSDGDSGWPWMVGAIIGIAVIVLLFLWFRRRRNVSPEEEKEEETATS